MHYDQLNKFNNFLAEKANLKYAEQMVCGVAMVELFSDMELSNAADR